MSWLSRWTLFSTADLDADDSLIRTTHRRRVDDLRRNKKSRTDDSGTGLLTATVSSEVFKAAQPALLYLVPFTLLPLLTMAYLKVRLPCL